MIRLGRYDGGDVPDGCMVAGDENGEWLVWAPELRQALRDSCPICTGDGEHDHA